MASASVALDPTAFHHVPATFACEPARGFFTLVALVLI